MNIHMSKRQFVAAAVLGALAIFATGFFVALGVRSVVAGPGASPGGPVSNPGHQWTELQDHGIDGGDYWLGTTDDQALELRVNNARALRLEPGGTSPEYCGPVFPTTFNGTVTVEGVPAADGTPISALDSDGVVWATATTSGGTYSMDVPETMPVTPPVSPAGRLASTVMAFQRPRPARPLAARRTST